MKYFIFLAFFFFSFISFAQKDSLRLGEKYWEDQLYILLTYNILEKQPTSSNGTGFSYGLSAGYIKDIPFNRKGNWTGAIGLGYGYDSFNHGLVYNNNLGNFRIDYIDTNKFSLHNIEIPIQIRWRTSNSVTYSFWRVYGGVRLSYNLNNSFRYILNNKNYEFNNISNFNRFQAGLELSLGYSTFSFYMYYGLSSIYKNTFINSAMVKTKIAKFGLIFYLL